MKQKLSIALLLFSISIIGCNTIENEDNRFSDSMSDSTQYLIPQETQTLTVEDAAKVAMKFQLSLNGANNTKATNKSEVESIYEINDDSGSSAMYAVNFNDGRGFVLVGATKNFYPILAYSDKGNFSSHRDQSGMDIWINQQKQLISCAKSLPADSVKVFHNDWLHFEKTSSDTPVTKTGDLWSLRTAAVSYWQGQGYDCIDLGLGANYLPSDVYADWCNYAEMMSDSDYDYMLSAFIIHKSINNNSQIGPLMATTWGQDSPYNALLTPINGELPRAGCSIAAMAQIMRYYEWPTIYNWSSMSNSTGTTATAQLYRDLGLDAQTNYGLNGSSTTINNLRQAITGSQYNYHYTASVVDHSYSTTVANINSYKPVYMQGRDPSDGSDHAWVCDGYKSNYTDESYMLVILPPDEPYTVVDGYAYDDYHLTTYLYMNWGEDGDANGWFYSDNVAFSGYLYNTLIEFNFSSLRKDIVNITPATN